MEGWKSLVCPGKGNEMILEDEISTAKGNSVRLEGSSRMGFVVVSLSLAFEVVSVLASTWMAQQPSFIVDPAT